MVDVSPVPKTLRTTFPTVRDAEQAYNCAPGEWVPRERYWLV